MSPEDRERIERSIAAYRKEQALLLRLMRFKGGSFTEHDFDRWFRGFKRSPRGRDADGQRIRRSPRSRFWPVTSDSFLLGLGRNGFNDWARMLDLLQHMVALGTVNVSRVGDLITYSIPGDP